MKPFNDDRRICRPLITLIFTAALAICALAAAAPGAHGPNGEHLDSAPGVAGGTAARHPRFETQSETFELVGSLRGGELAMFINHYATSEPVLNAAVEVETGELKARAKFHADLGDYAVDDPAFLNALAAGGQFPLLVTVVSGADADLLNATLVVPSSDHVHEPDHEHWWRSSKAGLWAGGLAAIIAAIAFSLRRRRKILDGPFAKDGVK